MRKTMPVNLPQLLAFRPRRQQHSLHRFSHLLSFTSIGLCSFSMEAYAHTLTVFEGAALVTPEGGPERIYAPGEPARLKELAPASALRLSAAEGNFELSAFEKSEPL